MENKRATVSINININESDMKEIKNYIDEKISKLQHEKVSSKDYLYKQLDKLSNKNYLSGNGNLAEDSLAMLEIVKYLDQEKRLEINTDYFKSDPAKRYSNILNKINHFD